MSCTKVQLLASIRRADDTFLGEAEKPLAHRLPPLNREATRIPGKKADGLLGRCLQF